MKKLLLITLLLPLFGNAQMTEEEVREIAANSPTEELIYLSSEMIQQNFLYHAEILVDRLLEIDPESPNFNYRKGFIEFTSRIDHINGINHFQKAVTETTKTYDPYSKKETGAPLDAIYYLAKCYHLNGELDKAADYYNQFLENSNKGSRLIDAANVGVSQVAVAKHEIANPKNVTVNNIGNTVNGPLADYAPVVSLDGNSLYFTSRRAWKGGDSDKYRDPLLNNYPEDIYVSYTDFDGNWMDPVKLEFCVDSLNEATIGVSADERRIYIYEDRSGGGDIYYSDIESNNKFEEMQKFRNKEVNTKYWETHCTMTPDLQHLYFASDRPEGYGGRDIYRLTRLPNGEWSKAQNMGPGINTPYDEDSPFIAVNNKTLYYASNGPKSMGGFDIFVTFRDDEGGWSEPINLGYPVNSCGDDIYYTTTVDGFKGYLSSYRADGFGEKDIYEIQNDYLGNHPISTLVGQFRMIDGSELPEDIDVKIFCKNCDFEAEKEINPRVKNEGRFFAPLQRCKDYKIEFYHNGEVIGSDDFVTLCNNENEEIEKIQYLGTYKLAGTVADANTLEFLEGAKIRLTERGTDKTIVSYTMDANGAFLDPEILEDNKPGDHIEFDVHVSHEGYLAQTFVVDTTLGRFNTLNIDYLLNKVDIGTEIGVLIDINPIYFDLDKSNIRPDAAAELDKIVQIMNENPNIVIELGSHTDCRASYSYNMSLSNRRAVSSAKYIQQRIDNPKRIYGKGYGESQLINDCGCEGNVVSDCTEEEHQANRRTEFKIVKK